MALDELLNAMAHRMSVSGIIVDRHFKLLAYSEQAPGVDEDRVRSILNRSCSRESLAEFIMAGHSTKTAPFLMPPLAASDVGRRLCIPVVDDRDDIYGYAFLIPNQGNDFADIDASLASRYIAAAAEEIRTISDQIGVRERQRHVLAELLRDVLAGKPASLERLSSAGVLAPDRPFVLLAVVGDDVPAMSGAVNTQMDGYTATLVPLENDAAYRDLLRRCTLLNAPVGASAIHDRLADLPASWREARLSAQVAKEDPRGGQVRPWDSLGIYQLALLDESEVVLSEPVRRLFAHRNPDLWRTALTYLDLAGDAAATAAALGIHRQTLYYRLSRINEVSGLDLANGHDRLTLHLGLAVGQFR